MSRKTLKIIIFSFLLVILFPSVGFGKVTYPEPSTKFYVNDYANVIDEEAENLMVQNGNALEERTGAQIVLVTVNFTDGISIDEYAAELFNKWKLGSAEKNNGLLILLSIGDEDYWTVQGKGLEATLTSGDIGQILDDYLEPDFAVADYSEGAVKVYEAFIKELGGNWAGKTDSGNVGDSKNNGNTENYGNNGNNKYSEPYQNARKLPNYPNLPNSPNNVVRIPSANFSFFKYLFFFFILFIIISSKRRKYYRRRFGIPFNPFSWIRIRRHGSGGYWGRYGPPPPGGGFWYNGRWNSKPRSQSGPGWNTPPRPGPGPGSGSGSGPFSSGGSPFGRSGGGGSTRGGGAGRSSFGRSSFGGGSSFGRSPFGGSKSFGGGKSFGGRSGGGGFTRGGGAGRHK